jgi:mannose/fructose/N-acetylgalactosamine-specific phosphotransferase system component IIC
MKIYWWIIIGVAAIGLGYAVYHFTSKKSDNKKSESKKG